MLPPAPTDLDALRACALADPSLPPGLARALGEGLPLEDIRLDARGRWWHQGEPFEHLRLRALFHRALQQTAHGTWLVVLPPFSYPVTVEGDHVFIVRWLDGGSRVRLADDAVRTLEGTRWETDGLDVVRVLWPDGLRARVVGSAWRTLEGWVDEDAGGAPVLRLPGGTVPLHVTRPDTPKP